MDAIQRREIFIHMRYANMTGEWTITIITSVISAIIGGVVTLFIERRKERREDKKENEKKKKKVFKKRPELKITEYKEYLSRPRHKLKKECDINVFMTKMEDVAVEGDCVTAHYNKDFFNEEEWCCVIYEFRNVGKTDIRCVSPICTYKKDTMLCDVKVNKLVLEHGSLSYSTMYDKKVRVDESFTMRICYHKDCISTGMFSAIMVMALEDCNNRYWEQPLFAPNDRIYESYKISRKEFRDEFLPKKAMECFKKPWLW